MATNTQHEINDTIDDLWSFHWAMDKPLREEFRATLKRLDNLLAALGAPAPVPPIHPHEFSDYSTCRICGLTAAAIEGGCHHCDDADSVKNGRCWWCLKRRTESYS